MTRVTIARSFSVDTSEGRVHYHAGAVEHPDADTARLWRDKGLATIENDPAPKPPSPEMTWPELRRRASAMTTEPIRSRAQAERIVTNPDAG